MIVGKYTQILNFIDIHHTRLGYNLHLFDRSDSDWDIGQLLRFSVGGSDINWPRIRPDLFQLDNTFSMAIIIVDG